MNRENTSKNQKLLARVFPIAQRTGQPAGIISVVFIAAPRRTPYGGY